MCGPQTLCLLVYKPHEYTPKSKVWLRHTLINYATAEGPRASDVGHVHDLSILQAGPLSAFRADYIHTFPFWLFHQYHQWGIPKMDDLQWKILQK